VRSFFLFSIWFAILLGLVALAAWTASQGKMLNGAGLALFCIAAWWLIGGSSRVGKRRRKSIRAPKISDYL
jgi:hypothetical protein